MDSVILIGGAEIKRICGIVCDYADTCAELLDNEVVSNGIAFYQKADNDYVFCNPLFLQAVIDEIDLSNKTLITHNTDSTLINYTNQTATFRYLNGTEWSITGVNPRNWFAQNSLVDQAIPLPLGPGEEPFDIPVPLTPQPIQKSVLIYKNFKIESNPIERNKCDFYVPVTNQYGNQLTRLEYYNRLAESFFCVSPNGYGIDCHRHWEALYYSCIPIVTKNKLTDYYSQYFPMCLIDDWADFDVNKYDFDLYQTMIKDFDRKYLTLEYYIANAKIQNHNSIL